MRRYLMVVMVGGAALASLAGDLVIEGNVTVVSNLAVRGSVEGLQAGSLTNGVLPASVMPTNGVWNAGALRVAGGLSVEPQGDLQMGPFTNRPAR